MHERSIHGKRLLGDWPLGLPAQKGWEILLFLIGLPPSPTLWKIPAGSVFIDAFVNRLLNCPYFTTVKWQCQYRGYTKNRQELSATFCTVHNCSWAKDETIHFFYEISVAPVIMLHHHQKNHNFVFFTRTKVLDRWKRGCYDVPNHYIWQMHLSGN